MTKRPSARGIFEIRTPPGTGLSSVHRLLLKHPNIRVREEPDGSIVVTEFTGPDFHQPKTERELIEHFKRLGREALALEDSERDNKPDGVVDYTVPELGQKLLPFLLPKKLRDAVVGDLAQDFQAYAAKFGRTYAVRWYWWELSWLCLSRFKFAAIVAPVAFWLRRKVGF